MKKIRKAIIPVAGMGTRFLPLSKELTKEFWPLVDKPIIQYIVEEAADSGIKEIIFVTKPGQNRILDYFKERLSYKKALKSRYKNHFLEELKKLEEISKKISFSQAIQKEPLGDGHAVLMAEKQSKGEPCAVLFSDDVVDAKVPCLKQLINVFEKYKEPVTALYKVPKSSFQFYGMIGGEKIENRVYQIEKMVEKPTVKDSPSNLAIIGKRIITPDVFSYLKKSRPNKKGEIILTETLSEMIKERKNIYGCEIEGKWLECGNKLAYLKSNLYFSLKHPKFGKELKTFLKYK